jgi:hypothetical protein
MTNTVEENSQDVYLQGIAEAEGQLHFSPNQSG